MGMRDAGSHTHSINGFTEYGPQIDVAGNTGYEEAGAIDAMDNRPKYVTLGFIQRVKQSI